MELAKVRLQLIKQGLTSEQCMSRVSSTSSLFGGRSGRGNHSVSVWVNLISLLFFINSPKHLSELHALQGLMDSIGLSECRGHIAIGQV